MKTTRYGIILIMTLASLMSYANSKESKQTSNLQDTAYEAFIYAYPLMEQVKTMNGMFEFMGLKPNVPA
jgi:hypothetical protein